MPANEQPPFRQAQDKPLPMEGNGPTMEYRGALILVVAVVVVAGGTLAAAGYSPANATALIGFGTVITIQFLAMLRGQLADVAATKERRAVAAELRVNTVTTEKVASRLNGGLDQRISDAISAATDHRFAELAAAMKDVQGESHKIKHEVEGLHQTQKFIEDLLKVAARKSDESPAEPRRPE